MPSEVKTGVWSQTIILKLDVINKQLHMTSKVKFYLRKNNNKGFWQ